MKHTVNYMSAYSQFKSNNALLFDTIANQTSPDMHTGELISPIFEDWFP